MIAGRTTANGWNSLPSV